MPFDYTSLPRPYPRTFVPEDLPFDWEAIQVPFDRLATREIDSPQALEKWISDESELDSVLSEQKTLRYVNYTRQTDNPGFRTEYERYTEELEPKIKLASFRLLTKYLDSPHRGALPRETYGLEDRRRAATFRVFRPENVPLEKEDSTLAQEYQRIVGAMTVQFRGEERTLQQMSKYYEETDRELRREAWTITDARAFVDAEKLSHIYDKMVLTRNQCAVNAGFANYRDYIFTKNFRFDYSPADCESFHRAVEEHIVPLSREIDDQRASKMGLDVLKPWDLRVDPEGRPPLNPFADADDLIGGCAKTIEKVDPVLASYFDSFRALGLLDLESRKGKAPGGYQDDFAEHRLPFIFMNSAGKDSDVRTLLHECGHAFHTLLMRDSGLPYFNSNAGLTHEFAEVASMSMELVGGEHLEGTFYDGKDARRSNYDEVASMVKLFAWVATIDSFQHWVYTNPGHSRSERTEAWLKTFQRFGGKEDYGGFERSLEVRWQRQLHLFEVPFYYIEYGIAMIGALNIWLRYKKDPVQALGQYKSALSMGSARSLPELFGAAGVTWDLGEGTIRGLGSALRTELLNYS